MLHQYNPLLVRVIGLTGGIGTGKSTVSRFLADLGAVILDADKVGHEAFKPGTPAWQDVVATFGKGVIAPSGEIDRKKLGAIVFGNPEALSRLNRIMHPRMFDMMKAQIEEYRRQGKDVVVLEAAILIEAGWDKLTDEVWVTVAPESTVLTRISSRSGLREEETLARIRAQLPSMERVKHAQVVVDTDCTLDELRARVKDLWDRLHTRGSA